MPGQDHEERLKRLGQEWFAEARRKDAEATPPPKRRDAGGDGDGLSGLFDWLFTEGSDDTGSGDD